MQSITPVLMGLFPLCVMTALILKFKVPIYLSVIFTLLLVAVICMGGLGTPLSTIAMSGAYGAVKGFWPIVLVIFAAIFAYNVMQETGAIKVIERSLSTVTEDQRVQILLISWCFGGFLEGAAGFSVSVAIPMSILLVLGFAPLKAAVATLMADTVSTAFGAVGIPMVVLADITHLPVNELSAAVILQLGVFNFLIPAAMVAVVGGGLGAVKGVLSLVIGIGVATTVPQYLTALHLGPQLVAFAGSLTSLVWLLLWVRFFGRRTPGEHRGSVRGEEERAAAPFGLLRAGVIYILMSGLIFFTSALFPDVQRALGAVVTPLHFPLPDGRVLTAKIDWLVTPGVLILISVLAGGLLQGATPGLYLRMFGRTARQLTPAGVAIMGIVAMATLMDVSGLIELTARPLISAAGEHFPYLSALFGMVGTFVTGSVVNSNVLFGKLQLLAAEEAGVSPLWLAAANAAGATAGKMIAPQSITIAASASSWLGERTDQMLSGAVRWCFGGVILLSLIVGLSA